MKEIKLSQGKFALVDNEDFDFLNSFIWQYRRRYASRVEYLGGGRKNQNY